MYKAIVFAGTTEGYALCRFLSENRVGVYACVATEYGSRSVKENAFLKVQAARLSTEEMEGLFREIRPEMVLDATHPYAAEVTENIRTACVNTNITYQRVLRDEGSRQEHAVYVDSPEEAVKYLEGTEGNILLTTGSKELGKFTALSGFQDRVFARVLSLPSVMTACASYGLEGKHLIGMQGPFSRELNAAMLRQYDCRYLVTKDSGKAGGFLEKAEAALECGAKLVIIGRPLKEEGVSLEECKRMLAERFRIQESRNGEENRSMQEPQNTQEPQNAQENQNVQHLRDAKRGMPGKSQVTLLGIGMGSRETLTIEGQKALEGADLLIGAKRMVDSVKLPHHETFYEYRSNVIADYITSHPEYQNVVIALSGDVGFYSGAKKLLDLLGEDTKLICGISSVVYFMAKAHLSWDDAKIVSAHGRNCNLVSLIRHHQKVFAILGTADGTAKLAGKLTDYGMGEVLLYVGENLSYENEKIFAAPAKELLDYKGDALSVVCAYHEQAVPMPATHGILDSEFIRGKAPMTKEEVRTVSLSKLKLMEDSICYDVGAGTGSVSIEMAFRAHQGMVYAVEKKEDAVELLWENKKKFAADNLEIIQGTAPEALEELPAPTHAFIGGSSGNLREIVEILLKKNEHVRIVINCITLETVSEALSAIREFAFEETDVVQLSASRAKVVGRYHMMMGENPIYIITCQRK